MNRFGAFFKATLFATLVSCAGGKASARDVTVATARADKPNIVFIFADDVGFGDVGANGNRVFRTPALDQLARDGTNFQQFTVASPVCSPSRASVLTGQFPDRNQVFQHFNTIEHHKRHGMPDWLDTSAPSIATVLKNAGYATGHFGKWHLTNSRVPDAPEPSQYGFDRYAVFNGPGPRTDAAQVFVDAMNFVSENKDRPFFLNLWIHETHTPHYPDPAIVRQYGELDEQTRMYAATLSTADRGVGQIRKLLTDLGLTKNTIVIFSSDNGPEVTGGLDQRFLRNDPDAAVPGREPLGTYYSVGQTAGLRGRKRDLFEGGIRVPFIVSWPGVVRKGRVDNEAVLNAVDLFPTFAAIAGGTIPQGIRFDGESVISALKGRKFQRSKPIFWQRLGALSPDGSHRTSIWASVREGRWKYFEEPGRAVALFNIADDPAEKNNVASEYPEIVARLAGKLKAWRAELPSEVPSTAKSTQRFK